jgi:glycosyltransferase involved in cell wall biosynthesis
MQRSQLIMVSSIKEGWGLIVTEANSQGTPAVVYNVDGLRDAATAGSGNSICNPDPAALAHAASAMLQEDDVDYQCRREQALAFAKNITFDRSYSDFAAAVGLPVIKS